MTPSLSSYFLYLLILVMIFTSNKAQLSFSVNEGNKQPGQMGRNPLEKFDVPFVPEEFKISPKRIVFDKNDFVSLLPSDDLQVPIKDAIQTLLEDIQSHSNETKIYNALSLLYVGLAKRGGRPGQSAHFAATVKVQLCERNMTSCHFEECDLDLDQKDQTNPHNYQPVFTLHSKECQRLDSWCYFCQAYDDLDRPVEGPLSCKTSPGNLPQKRNCNAKKGDLSVTQQWGCKTTFAIVAGQSEVIEKDCVALSSLDENESDCKSLDDSDYEVECSCKQGSGCNLHDEQNVNLNDENDAILSEVNKSIRQLRADLKRVIRRYSRSQDTEE